MLLYGMTIYFFIFLFIFELKKRTITPNAYNADINGKFEKNIALIFLAFLWFITAFRSENIGNDTIVYIRYFERIDTYGTNPSYSIEMGFQWLILLIGKFTDDPHFFLIIISTILYLILGTVILKYSTDYFVSSFLAFFLCFGSFCNIIRQALAMMICLIAYTKLKNRNWIQFICFVIIASIFHISALACLLLLLYPIFPKSKKILFIICVVAIALSGTSFLLYISHLLGDEYTGYFNSKYADSGQLGTFLSLVKCTLVYLIIQNVYKSEECKPNDSECNIMYTNASFMLIFLCCGFTVNLIARIADYFVIMSIIDLPVAVNSNKKKNKTLFIMLFVYIIIHFVAVQIFRPEWNHLYPYRFWSD